MAIIASDKSEQFELPEPGLVRAVCIDVVDLGEEETPWGEKEKVKIVWEIDEAHPKFGNPFRVNKKYTLSLNEKANLCQDLESWRGRQFTEKEKKGFDVEKLMGVPCMVNIVHNESNGRTWANVKAVLPMRRGEEGLKPSGSYVREIDRQTRTEEVGGDGAEYENNFATEKDKDDLPF